VKTIWTLCSPYRLRIADRRASKPVDFLRKLAILWLIGLNDFTGYDVNWVGNNFYGVGQFRGER